MSFETIDRIRILEERIKLYLSRVLNFPLVKPELVILDLTHRCNLACAMCDIRKKSTTRESELESREVFSIIDQVAEWKIEHLVFSGGEPTMREDLLELLRYGKEKKVKIGILTNGAFSASMLKKLSPYLQDGECSLTVSLDGVKAETHDYVRGTKGAFARTIATLERLAGLKRDYPRMYIEVISIIMNHNLEELGSIISLVRELNVNALQFQPLLQSNLVLNARHQGTPLWIPASRLPILDEALDGIIDFRRKGDDFISNSLSSLELMRKYFRRELRNDDIKCFALYKSMLIATNGDLTACNANYGNVRRGEIQSWWRSDRAWRSRMTIKKCTSPCILPCFSDASLNTLSLIFGAFFSYLDGAMAGAMPDVREAAKDCLAMVEKYERLLQKISGEAFSPEEIENTLEELRSMKVSLQRYERGGAPRTCTI
jgi:MoaA/NifB/PqqE/SkfB family radical SAM enzyme